MAEPIDIENADWAGDIQFVLQFILPRRDNWYGDTGACTTALNCECKDALTPCTFTSFTDLEHLDGEPRDLEEECGQTGKSDPAVLTVMTGTLDLAEPDVKARMATMTQKRRKTSTEERRP